MANAREALLRERLEDHRAAIREFVGKAEALSATQWLTPRGDGKWTPAQETRHLVLTYEAFVRDLQDIDRMRLRGTPLQRWIWKLLGLASILWGKRIPVAVRAPSVIRPDEITTPAPDLLDALRDGVARFEGVFTDKWRREPARRVSHPFFGLITLDHAVRIAAVHARHHAAFLPVPTTPTGEHHALHALVDASPGRGTGMR